LRAFLTSILVKPEKSRGPLVWLRHWREERVKPGPAVMTKAGAPVPAPEAEPKLQAEAESEENGALELETGEAKAPVVSKGQEG